MRLAKKLCMLSLVVFLTGCWDSVEINNRSVILEFAIDKNMDKVDEDASLDMQSVYNITYSIPDMAQLSGLDSLAEDMKTNIMVQAPTIATSVDDLETRTRNTVTFSHVKVILLGEDLLKDAKLLEESIDAITRGRVIARNVPLLAVKGKAEDAQNIQNSQQPILGLYIMNYFNNRERPKAYFKPQLLGNFIRDMQDTGVATMPIFHLPETIEEDSDTTYPVTEYEISGGAIIKNYELVDYVDKEVVRGQLLIDGDSKNSPVVIEYKDRPLTYILQRQNSKIKFNDGPEGVFCIIEIETVGDIAEYVSTSHESLFTIETIEEVKNLVADEVAKQVFWAIDRAKDMNVDFLKIGQEMYRKYPDLWERYEENWEVDGFRNMPITVQITTNIENTGIIQ
ncbi:MAG: hypothetical protein ATN35_10300 [Epulopiscium sp. Nele67-Bin004]|nr:MAG: hypothetical protein ATN35_10300 [Epulopiscium sp. Nele67-Bin004]